VGMSRARFRNQLDLSRIGPWYLITQAVAEMMFQKKLEILPVFTQYLPRMLTELSLDDPGFMILISTFSSTAMK
jgi:hypothetical protein